MNALITFIISFSILCLWGITQLIKNDFLDLIARTFMWAYLIILTSIGSMLLLLSFFSSMLGPGGI